MISAGVKVFLASHPIDFRKGPDSLLSLVRDAGSDSPFFESDDKLCFVNFALAALNLADEKLFENALAAVGKHSLQSPVTGATH